MVVVAIVLDTMYLRKPYKSWLITLGLKFAYCHTDETALVKLPTARSIATQIPNQVDFKNIFTWSLTAAIPDLGGKGNLAGFIIDREYVHSIEYSYTHIL
jgi:hypothetical protein